MRKQETIFGIILQSTNYKAPRSSIQLDEIEKVMPWAIIIPYLKEIHVEGVGRNGYSLEVMFRIFLLQSWYGLSDREIEEMIHDRISFKKFLGLDVGHNIPDHSTICKFRLALNKNQLQNKLLNIINNYLEEKGIIIKQGIIEDATIISAPMNKNNKDKEWIDKEAGSTKKGDQWYRGYKLHVGMDISSNVIRKMEVTSASVSDSEIFEQLLSGDEKAVFADKAYTKKDRKKLFRRLGIYNGILDKSNKGHKLSSKQEKLNKKKSKIRCKVEHVFNVIKNIFNYKKVRYLGIIKNTLHMNFIVMLYNIRVCRKKLLAIV